jgi:hypothetical protein
MFMLENMISENRRLQHALNAGRLYANILALNYKLDLGLEKEKIKKYAMTYEFIIHKILYRT